MRARALAGSRGQRFGCLSPHLAARGRAAMLGPEGAWQNSLGGVPPRRSDNRRELDDEARCQPPARALAAPPSQCTRRMSRWCRSRRGARTAGLPGRRTAQRPGEMRAGKARIRLTRGRCPSAAGVSAGAQVSRAPNTCDGATCAVGAARVGIPRVKTRWASRSRAEDYR